MFDKFGEAAIEVLYDAYGNSRRFKSDSITTEQILTALTMDQDNLAAQALASMNISSESIVAELERALLTGKTKDIAPAQFEVCHTDIEEMKFSFPAKVALKRAAEFRAFYGHLRVEPEHILLALIDIRDESSMKILEELGANVTYLNRLMTGLLAERDALDPETQNLKTSVIQGLEYLVDERLSVLEDLERLSTATGVHIADLPQRSDISHLVFTAFMPDFLFIQIGFQRYLLEATMKMLTKRAGNIDPEFAASTVSTSAQNLRAAVRHTIEHVWSHGFRHLSKLPDEADYDLIGSVIEDLWWTHSEEIALNQVFDAAVDDHRREQMLDLQKRRLEISERFVKLRSRLSDVVRQCFVKRSQPA
jgi:hypothetical protein